MPEKQPDVEYRGYLIEDHYPMSWGWVWSDPDTYDDEAIDAGNGTLQECKDAIDEFLTEQTEKETT